MEKPATTKHRVIVKGISENCAWQDLKDHFRQIGEVSYAVVFSGYGMVDFTCSEDAMKAIQTFNGATFQGNTISVAKFAGTAAKKPASKTKKAGRCDICEISFSKVSRGHNGCCVKCDTTPCGTWALNYLAEQDLIESYDTIEDGYMVGRAMNGFLGLKEGTEIMCQVDKYNRNLFHCTYNPNTKEKSQEKLQETYQTYDEDVEDDESTDIEHESSNDEDDSDDEEAFYEREDAPKIDFRVYMDIQVVSRM